MQGNADHGGRVTTRPYIDDDRGNAGNADHGGRVTTRLYIDDHH
jgi:hypothetical protein